MKPIPTGMFHLPEFLVRGGVAIFITALMADCRSAPSNISPSLKSATSATALAGVQAAPDIPGAVRSGDTFSASTRWSEVEPSSVLFPVNYFKVVLQRGIRGVRLRGAPALEGEPDDYDDTYLARCDIDESSLAKHIRELRGKTATIFYPDGTVCRAILGRISAYSWLMSDNPTKDLGSPTASQRERIVAARTMARGYKFLAAEYEKDKCQEGLWAAIEAPEDLRTLPVRKADQLLEATALEKTKNTDAYGARQLKYQNFKAAEEGRVARMRTERKLPADGWPGPPYPRGGPFSKGPPLPVAWSEFFGAAKVWSVGEAGGPQLLVAFVASRAQAFGFQSTLTAVFSSSETSVPNFRYWGPHDGGPMWPSFELLGAMSWSSGLPLLLYSNGGRIGALRPMAGKYVNDEALEFGPKE